MDFGFIQAYRSKELIIASNIQSKEMRVSLIQISNELLNSMCQLLFQLSWMRVLNLNFFEESC
jgi:hypothetical protein